MREEFITSLKAAMKAGDKMRVSTLRLVQAAIKDKDIEARGLGKTVSDDDILALLQKMVKQRQESLAIFEREKREDLASIERSEIAIITSFLPQQLDEAAVKAAIAAAIAETGAGGIKDMGKVVGALKAKYSGQMDFGKASGLVKAALAG